MTQATEKKKIAALTALIPNLQKSASCEEHNGFCQSRLKVVSERPSVNRFRLTLIVCCAAGDMIVRGRKMAGYPQQQQQYNPQLQHVHSDPSFGHHQRSNSAGGHPHPSYVPPPHQQQQPIQMQQQQMQMGAPPPAGYYFPPNPPPPQQHMMAAPSAAGGGGGGGGSGGGLARPTISKYPSGAFPNIPTVPEGAPAPPTPAPPTPSLGNWLSYLGEMKVCASRCRSVAQSLSSFARATVIG